MTEIDYRKTVGAHVFVMTEPPIRIPTGQIPDAPLLGNGDIGVAIGGTCERPVFIFGKNDFWTQAHLGESESQRYERLISEQGRRTGTHIGVVGSLELCIPQLEGASYRYEIDLLKASARGTFETAQGTAMLSSIVCAQANLLITRIRWSGEQPLVISRRVTAGPLNEYEVYAADCGLRDDVLWFRYAANPQRLPGRRMAALASRALGGSEVGRTDRPHFDQRIVTELRRGEEVTLCTALLSDLNASDCLEAALEMCAQLDTAMVERHIAGHEAWWDDFWSRSKVCLSDKTLEKWYYAGQYIIASAIRQGQPVPGLNGPWNTVEKPRWTGSYTLNYNYESPLWGLYTSNHVELTDSYQDTLLAVIPLAQRFARDMLGVDGIYLPVELGPWGTVCSMLFHNQKTYASFCCVNLFMRYYMTLDVEYARAVFPFVEQAAIFWECYLRYENGAYVDYEDCPHEEMIPSHCANNPLALALIRQTMRGALDMACAIGRPEDPHSRKWRHILEHLSPLPRIERNGREVVAYSAPGGRQWYERGGVGMWFVYPGQMVNLDSDPELLELARATFAAHDAWDDGNAFNSWYVIAARLGIDPELVRARMLEQIRLHGWSNGVIWHGGGGIEDASGVVSYINESMLQSVSGVLRLFPAWPSSMDGAFEGLRAYGAFLVSGEYAAGRIESFKVVSEKGTRLRICNPWPGQRVRCICDGEAVQLYGDILELDTIKGAQYCFSALDRQ